MRQINTAKNQQIIYNHVIPTNAVYGRFTFEFTRKIRTDKVLLDKKGRIIFGKDGNPKYRYKKIPTKTTAIFSVENFTLYKFGNERHLYAFILYENGKNWHEIALGDTPFSKALEELVLSYIKENNLKEPERPHVKTKIRSIAPKRRRENQFDSVFRMRPEYSGTINEDVKPRMPIVKTNMGKIHPIDERPIVSTKTHSYDDSKVIHPENGGYIHHEDGSITTRNGDKVEVAIKTKPCHESKPKTVIVNNKNRKPARAGYHYAG